MMSRQVATAGEVGKLAKGPGLIADGGVVAPPKPSPQNGEERPKNAKKQKTVQQTVAAKISACSTRLSEISAWDSKCKDSSL